MGPARRKIGRKNEVGTIYSLHARSKERETIQPILGPRGTGTIAQPRQLLSGPSLRSSPDLAAECQISQLFNKRLLGYLSWRRKRRLVHRRDIVDSLVKDLHAICPDHIVVTGDLTHIGLPDEFAEAAQWLPCLGLPDRSPLSRAIMMLMPAANGRKSLLYGRPTSSPTVNR